MLIIRCHQVVTAILMVKSMAPDIYVFQRLFCSSGIMYFCRVRDTQGERAALAICHGVRLLLMHASVPRLLLHPATVPETIIPST